MSEEKENKAAGEESENDVAFADLAPADSVSEKVEGKFLELTINRSTNELIIREPETGKAVKLAARITQIEEEDADIRPLTPDEFRTALERIDALGLTWTADRVASVKPKQSVSDDVLLSDEFEKIQQDYPALPIEVSAIVFHSLTGSHASAEIVGSQDDLEKKKAIVDDVLITPEYRSEFFFKHATKVPYLTEIDWEVVFKLAEKNVKEMPGISYALLSLRFLDPGRGSNARQQERTFTVAVDEKLVEGLINTLTEVKNKLADARSITEEVMKAESSLKENDDADNSSAEQKRLE